MSNNENKALNQFAQNLYDRVLESLTSAQLSVTEQDVIYLQRISVASPYAAEQIIRNPSIYSQWSQHYQSSDLSIIADYQWMQSDEISTKKTLRGFRHQFLVEIILNDICLEHSVQSILLQVSELANVLIQSGLNAATLKLAATHGMPLNAQGEEQYLMVMAMGKLGGGELNFSSDVDLIYVYAEDGELTGTGKLSFREFYIRVGRLMTKLLNDVTADGFVYRVDLRLRPWGDSGPLVINLSGLENYYQLHGRDWERYALVKAGVITGNTQDKTNLDKVIKPFVYRKYHDFNVFSGLGGLKQQIDVEARKKNKKLNIKLCSGGIREIEFCMQALQILQGGRHQQLQVTSIIKMFELAKEETFFSAQELHDLKHSYLFFRLVENRIQMLNDQQTHDLPSDDEAQLRLLVSLNMDSWSQLTQQLEAAQLSVHSIFKQLFLEHQESSDGIDFSQYDLEQWQDYFNKQSLNDESSQSKALCRLFQEKTILVMSKKGKERLNQLLPDLLSLINQHENTQVLLNLMTDLLLAIARRSVYLELMSLHQPLLNKLVDLFADSQWLAEEIIRYPILLESVLITEADESFEKQNLINKLDKELIQVKNDEEMQLDVLRVFKRQQVFQIALKELDGKIQPLQASQYLSELAGIMLQASYQLNLTRLVEQYGEPCYELDGQLHKAYLGVIAYGKLGGQELHYTSDLDVIFLHNSTAQKQQTNGEKSIDNGQFFSRLAQKIISTVSMLTSSGKLYEIDARLRPNGASGFLVSSLEAYETYQYEKAWVWEHQALVRATWVAGDSVLIGQFEKIKCAVMAAQSNKAELKQEVFDMREKMYQAKIVNVPKNQNFNLKQSRGGLVDIEFMVQYFVLINANKLSSLCQYSDNIALLEHLLGNQCIAPEYQTLIEIYHKLHQQLHLQVLHHHYETDLNQSLSNEIETVKKLWQQSFN